tara:strand:+ start:3796 stop:4734 length:939 start_codon:yes stop_codon:yes gene_type:complete
MAFQDNSGDIILDVVLTDEGRRRLARGDGSFSIVKFALADDEINYELFETGSTTALQDLSILQTPVLEAFTNNMSSMKSKLLSLSDNTLFYLPVLKINTSANTSVQTHTLGNYAVLIDQNTTDNKPLGLSTSLGYDANGNINTGMIFGISTENIGSYIKVDAGINSTNVTEIDESLIETEFSIEIDSRLGSIVDKDGKVFLEPTAIDDDHIATYIIRKTPGSPFVFTPSQEALEASTSPINGPIASTLEFKIRSSQDLRVSNYLFDRIGTTTTAYTARDSSTPTVKMIDSIVRVSGLSTGYSLDLPVRFLKL